MAYSHRCKRTPDHFEWDVTARLQILCSLSTLTYRSGLAPASMPSTTVDAAVDQSTCSTPSNESIDEQELKHAPGSCHVAQASSLSPDCKMWTTYARSVTVTSNLLRPTGKHDQTRTTSSKPTSSCRNRSPENSTVRLPSPDRANHQLPHAVTTHSREPSYAGFRHDVRAGNEEGKNARRRRSASPRGVRQLQRECDILVLMLEKQRSDNAMRRKERSEAKCQEVGS